MKSLDLVISDQAREDLIQIWLYISDSSPAEADRFVDHLYDKCLLLKEYPEMGRQRDEFLPGIRCHPVKRYLVFYRITSSAVEIIRVLSAYRDIESVF